MVTLVEAWPSRRCAALLDAPVENAKEPATSSRSSRTRSGMPIRSMTREQDTVPWLAGRARRRVASVAPQAPNAGVKACLGFSLAQERATRRRKAQHRRTQGSCQVWRDTWQPPRYRAVTIEKPSELLDQ